MKTDELFTSDSSWYIHSDLAPSREVKINDFKNSAKVKIDQIQSDNDDLRYPDTFHAERIKRLSQLSNFTAKLATVRGGEYGGIAIFDLNIDLHPAALENFQDKEDEINDIFGLYDMPAKVNSGNNYPDGVALQIMESIRREAHQEAEWGRQAANDDLLDLLTSGASSTNEEQHDQLDRWHFFDTTLPGIGAAIRRHDQTRNNDDLIIYLKNKLADNRLTPPSLPQ